MGFSQFLERDPTKRLGCRQNGPAESFEDLKRHPWFSSIDWDTLDTKEQTAPFIPDVCPPSLIVLMVTYPITAFQNKKANFDASHELEELLLEDNPLRAKQRKERDISSLSAEMRQMEEQYVTVFSRFYRATLSSLHRLLLMWIVRSSGLPRTISRRCIVGRITPRRRSSRP